MLQLLKEPKMLQFSLLIREDDGPAKVEITDSSIASKMSNELKLLSIPHLMQVLEHPGVTKFEIEPTPYLRDLSNLFGSSIDFWTFLNKDERFTKFFVDSKTQGRFIRYLRSNNIEYTTVVSGDEGILEFRFEPGLNYSRILATFGGNLDYWTPLVKDGEPITILVKAEAVANMTEFLKKKKVFFNRINTYEAPKQTTLFFLHLKYVPQPMLGEIFKFMANHTSIKYIEKEPVEFIFRHELGVDVVKPLKLKRVWFSIEEWPTEFKVMPKIDSAMRIRDMGRIFGNKVTIWGPKFTQADCLKVMVSADVGKEFIQYLKNHKIYYKEIIPDVEELLESRSKPSDMYTFNNKGGSLDFNRYEKYDTLVEYLYDLAVKYPNIISIDNLGQSTEGKEIVVAKLSISKEDINKPIILIDAGIHAREWIAPAAALFIIKQLTEVSINMRLMKYIDWYIIPVLNPDGYEYSRENDRLWRKNRKRYLNSTCVGVDLNRNFDFQWSNALNDPCSESYPGPKPFSEAETINFREYVRSLGTRIKLYVSLHSYGNMILYPWGYTESSPQNVDSLQRLGEEVSKKIRDLNQGSSYKVGRISEMLYKASGCSVDWMKETMGVNYTYAIEIFDGESNGEFEPGPQHILKCVQEVFVGLKVLNYHIERHYVNDATDQVTAESHIEYANKTETTPTIVTVTEKESTDSGFWSSWFD
ncbi:mast cell carboxypeptidase A-like [Agrilus planipennis]|uniref:Mast cell carboxypeptidase A-like n=1 Tax=Agrilus planipennis TaxID=224129 RepID=A0A1W4XGQ8_AGRPL|nr:mast cell carboxypeptidase A-like [Agrilus planipennis]